LKSLERFSFRVWVCLNGMLLENTLKEKSSKKKFTTTIITIYNSEHNLLHFQFFNFERTINNQGRRLANFDFDCRVPMCLQPTTLP
jgi:hypothetical protein